MFPIGDYFLLASPLGLYIFISPWKAAEEINQRENRKKRQTDGQTDRRSEAVLQFFQMMHAFKRTVLDHWDSVVTQITAIITHNDNNN